MYKIIQSQSVPGLEQEVNKSLDAGFALSGGPFTSAGMFYQALIKNNMVDQVMARPKETTQNEKHTGIGRVVDGTGTKGNDGKAATAHSGNAKPHVSSPKFSFGE